MIAGDIIVRRLLARNRRGKEGGLGSSGSGSTPGRARREMERAEKERKKEEKEKDKGEGRISVLMGRRRGKVCLTFCPFSLCRAATFLWAVTAYFRLCVPSTNC